jgi:hypothetical protein
MIWVINKTLEGYKGFEYEKTRIVLLDRERAKIQRALTQFINEWVDTGVSIVSNG